MSNYCKAYKLDKLRQFPAWSERSENIRKEIKSENSKEIAVPRELTNDDFLYLHDSFVVTDGIFEEKNVIFDKVTPEWKTYCREILKFDIPVYEPVTITEDNENIESESKN